MTATKDGSGMFELSDMAVSLKILLNSVTEKISRHITQYYIIIQIQDDPIYSTLWHLHNTLQEHI